MKTSLTIFAAAFLSVIIGCQQKAKEEKLPAKEKKALAGRKELLTVDFKEGQTLRYKFVSSREIEVNWNPGKKLSKSGKSTIDKSTESMEMVVAYTPMQVDPFGLTTVKASCESVKIRRSRGPQRDAAETLAGKSFTLTVGPTGRIEDYSQLEDLIRQTGQKAFRPNTGRGRIKEPDMIGDFSATQWFLWDSVCSINQGSQGVSVGQSWDSKLPVTGPMVMRKARAVTYKLAAIRRREKDRLAVIRSRFSPTESVPDNWPPMPYTGRFQMSGTFGFLRGYQILDLQGQGEELFNIDAGRIEQSQQQYQVQLQAFIPLGINVRPQITMKQTLTMHLLK